MNLHRNYWSFIPADIDHKAYEDSIVSTGASSANEMLFKEIVKIMGPEKKRVLDLACGDGMFGKIARELGASWEITGIDFAIPERSEQSNFRHYDHVLEKNVFECDFGEYDYIVANHFFEHLYINELIGLLEKMKGKKLLISVPLAHITFAYNKYYLRASEQVTQVKNYQHLIGGIHKTCFDRKLIGYLGFEKAESTSGCIILVKKRELTDKEKYQAQLYITSMQNKLRYQLWNYITFLLFFPIRMIKGLFH